MRTRSHGSPAGSSPRGVPAGERGSVTIQMVILAPAMFLFLFMAVQAGLWFHARALALGAAQDGARVAAGENSSAGAGTAAAADFVAQGGGDGVLRGAAASGSRSATTATVTVTGTAPSLIPGWSPGIVQSASFSVERITGSAGGLVITESTDGRNWGV